MICCICRFLSPLPLPYSRLYSLFPFSNLLRLLKPVQAHAFSRTLFIMFLKFPSHLFKPNLFFLQGPCFFPPISLQKAISNCTFLHYFYIISLLEVLQLIVYFLELLLNTVSFNHVIYATKF